MGRRAVIVPRYAERKIAIAALESIERLKLLISSGFEAITPYKRLSRKLPSLKIASRTGPRGKTPNIPVALELFNVNPQK